MKKRKKHPPIIPPRRRTDRDRAAAIAGDPKNDSRGRWKPEFFALRSMPGPYGRIYARVHLRNKHGDMYLCWNDGGKIRTFYVGRRKQKPPTPGRAAAPDQAAAGALEAIDRRRGKKA